MRILHIVPSYFPAVRYGGPIVSVHGLAKASVAAGHSVDVFTTNADGPGALAVPTDRWVDVDGVRVRYFARARPLRLFRAPAMATAARQALRDYDVVHIHAIFLWPIVTMARACRKAGVPYVLSPRGMLVKSLFQARSGLVKRLWMALFDRRTLEQASALHLTAQTEADDIAAFGYALPPIAIIPNGVDTVQPSRTEQVKTNNPPFLLSLGRINWKKNLPALVAGFAMADVADLRLVIAGNVEDGDLAAVRSAVADHQLEARVTIIDHSVEGEEKAALFADCAAFILPSLSENFGNVVVEAMAAGAPVIVTERCGVADVVRAANCGLVCAPDAASLGHAIDQMFADPQTMHSQGQAGQRYARAHLSWSAIAARMDALYRSVVKTRHA
ncbi:MAG: glycosyltransferase [Sphingopyxis sp.]